MEKVWEQLYSRLDAIEKRIENIESLCQEPLSELKSEGETFPEQQQRKAQETIEGHKPDRKFEKGNEVVK